MDLPDVSSLLIVVLLLWVALSLAIIGGVGWLIWRMMAVLPLLAAAPALAQPAPPPRFAMQPIGAMCGAAADHLRVLDANGFEPAWRGSNTSGDAAFLVINDEGYWILLVAFAGRRGEACVIGAGNRFTYAPSPF